MAIEDHLQAIRKAATWTLKSPSLPFEDRATINDGGGGAVSEGTTGEEGVESLETTPWVGKSEEVRDGGMEEGWGVISGSGGSVKSEKGVGYQTVFFEPREICGARIGSKNLLCLTSRKGCQIKSHKHSEVAELGAGSHVGLTKVVTGSDKPPGAIVADCFLSTNVVPAATLASWSNTETTLQEWQALFATVEDAVPSELLTPDKIKSRSTKLLTATKSLRKEFEDETSSENSFADLFQAGGEANDWVFSPTKVGPFLSVLQEEALFAQKELPAQVIANFHATQNIGTMVDHTAEAVNALKAITEHESHHVRKAFANVHVKIRSIGILLGQHPPKSSFSSLWGATAALQHGLAEVEEHLKVLPKPEELSSIFNRLSLLPSPEQIKQDGAKLKASIEESMRNHARTVPSYVLKLQNDMSQVESWIGSVTGLLAQLPQRQSDLERVIQGIQSAGNGSLLTGVTATASSGSAAEVKALRKELAAFKSELQDLKAAKEDGAVTFGNLTFRSKAEVADWLKIHNSSKESWEQFVDPLIMFQRLLDSNKKEGMIRRHVDNQKTGIKTEMESCSLDSLQHPLPEIFHKGGPVFSRRMDESSLDQLKKAEDWSDGEDGMKPHLMHSLDNLGSHWSDQALNECGHSPELLALVNAMIMESERFIATLAEFVDSQFRSLTRTSKFGQVQSWSLVTRLVKRVLEDLYVPKRAHVKTIDLTNRRDTSATILWTSLSTLKIATAYLKGGISNHSSIASEYIKFMALRSGSEKVDEVVGKVDKLFTQVKTLEKEGAATRSKADTASNKTTELAKDLKALEKRVDKK